MKMEVNTLFSRFTHYKKNLNFQHKLTFKLQDRKQKSSLTALSQDSTAPVQWGLEKKANPLRLGTLFIYSPQLAAQTPVCKKNIQMKSLSVAYHRANFNSSLFSEYFSLIINPITEQ